MLPAPVNIDRVHELAGTRTRERDQFLTFFVGTDGCTENT